MTPDQLIRAANLWEAGMNTLEIASILGLDEDVVYNRLSLFRRAADPRPARMVRA